MKLAALILTAFALVVSAPAPAAAEDDPVGAELLRMDPPAMVPLPGLSAYLPESGGRIDLPGGTVIEVERVDIREVAYRADFRWQTRRASDVTPEILAAYNAKQESRA